MPWTMPAEWEAHERTLMSWPTRASLWGERFAGACREYAGVANAIAAFEPLTMVVAPGAAPAARALLDARVELVELPIDDSWMRDNGPIFVTDGDGRRAGVHFRFNSWGERFAPWDKDAALPEPLLARLGIERIASDLVLEGGSISVDGAGTLITTAQCLLNPNRNPDRSRAEIERELAERLGVSTIVWLPYGHHDDAHTDGHTDGVCVFIAPGVVLAQTCAEPGIPTSSGWRRIAPRSPPRATRRAIRCASSSCRSIPGTRRTASAGRSATPTSTSSTAARSCRSPTTRSTGTRST